jgi:hypothetical protein
MPHIVLLGAGASRAAFPSGELNGRKLPLMADFVETVGLLDVIQKYELDDPGPAFEAFFSELVQKDPAHPAIAELQTAIRSYFAAMALPPYATLYDRLLLSLQPRDLIATFNWDPLLFLAIWRNRHLVRLPTVVALHGSVALGACRHEHSFGYRWINCNVCGESYDDVPLLYPVHAKNYSASGFIAGQWDYLRRAMKRNALLTIFGFSAPATDVEAVQLLHDMVSTSDLRDINEFEIIDVQQRDTLVEKWKPFFVNHHYSIHASFDGSVLTNYPRRTPEWLWMTQMLLTPFSSLALADSTDLHVLQESARALMREDVESAPDSQDG